MAKIGRLTKLKSAIKRWPSLTKLARTNSSASAILAANNGCNGVSKDPHHHDDDHQLHAVYVGKSRRRYLLSSDTICHPLFQELTERSSSCGNSDHDGEDVVVSCEVVLFEHLLWMLGNGGSQSDSMEELAEFYHTC